MDSNSVNFSLPSSFDSGAGILVFGVGGGGGNAVERMIETDVRNVGFVCANTDAQALGKSSAGLKIQMGKTGLGAGSRPEAGKAAAEGSLEEIHRALDGAHMVFITAGMGGGTGTGAAPIVARVARDKGILTVGVVTKPFEFEGSRRTRQADVGLAELESCVDSLIVVCNDNLLDVLGEDVTQEEAFAAGNDVLRNAVGGISDVIHVPGLVNVDFEDVRTVMGERGRAMMGSASASGPDRAAKAAQGAVACPLLDKVSLSGARGILVLIAARRQDFRLSESRSAMSVIRQHASEDAHIIYGAAYDEALGEEMRVTVIATGLGSVGPTQSLPVAAVSAAVRFQQKGRPAPSSGFFPTLTETVAVPVPVATAGAGRGSAPQPAASRPSVWRSARGG